MDLERISTISSARCWSPGCMGCSSVMNMCRFMSLPPMSISWPDMASLAARAASGNWSPSCCMSFMSMPGMELEFCGAAPCCGVEDCCARAAVVAPKSAKAAAAKSMAARVRVLVRVLISASLITLREAQREYFGAKRAMRETVIRLTAEAQKTQRKDREREMAQCVQHPSDRKRTRRGPQGANPCRIGRGGGPGGRASTWGTTGLLLG